MAELNIYSEGKGKKELTLKVNDLNDQLIKKIVNRGFDWINGRYTSVTKVADILADAANQPAEIKPMKATLPSVEKEHQQLNIDERIKNFVSKVNKPDPDAHPDKPKRRVVKDEIIDDDAQRELPYPERVIVPVSVECPSCGKNIIRFAPYGSYFTWCPECDTKLHLEPMDGHPDEQGVYSHASELFLDKPPATEDDMKVGDGSD